MSNKLRPRKHIFREFSSRKKARVSDNSLKNLRSTLHDFQDKYELFQKELMFLLWAYDLEFWTLKYASEEYGYVQKKLAIKIVYPLVNEGYLCKYYDKLTPNEDDETRALFHSETKFNYRVRYALTQKARLMVQRFYNSLTSS